MVSEGTTKSFAWEVRGTLLIQFHLRIFSQLVLCRRSYVRRHGISIMELEEMLDGQVMRILERRSTYRLGRWVTS